MSKAQPPTTKVRLVFLLVLLILFLLLLVLVLILVLVSLPRYANWTLQLLALKAVELYMADSIGHETVHRTKKKRPTSRKL